MIVLASVAGVACAASSWDGSLELDYEPSVLLSGLFTRPWPALFDESFNDRRAGASTFELVSRDCVSARTLICGKVSAIVRARHSMDKGCSPLVAESNGLPCAFRSDRGGYCVDERLFALLCSTICADCSCSLASQLSQLCFGVSGHPAAALAAIYASP